jgi:hypothetical protein
MPPVITTHIGEELSCIRNRMTRITSCTRCITDYICRNSRLIQFIHTRRIQYIHTRLIQYIHTSLIGYIQDINPSSTWMDIRALKEATIR